MSLTVERGIKLIPSGGDNIIKVGVTSTSERLSGYIDATSVPYVTSFTFINQDINRIIGLETLKDLIELDISGNRYLSFNPVEHLLDQKPIKLYNVSDTQCYGFMSFLSTYPGIEYFYANNTLLSGDIKLPPSLKLAEILGYEKKSTLIKELAPLTDNPNLVYLNCSNNKLKGNIEIGKLPNAIHLDFSKNKFSRVILNTLTVQTSNVRVFNIADNEIAAPEGEIAKNTVGLEDIYNVLKFFEKLKREYQKGRSPQNNYDYVLNLSGAYMPALPSRPYDYGYLNLLIGELVASLTASPYPWKVHMGDFIIKESGASINRARTEAFADPDVRSYIRAWEERNNETIPTRDIILVDSKVKRLKTITAPVTASMIETTNPALTSSNRCLLSSVEVSPGEFEHKWIIGSFWDLVGLNFEPDSDHTEYIEEFKTSYLQSKGTSLIYYLELLWFIKTAKWLGYWDSMILWPLKWGQYVNKYDGLPGSMIMIDSFGGGQVNPDYVNTGTKRHKLRLWFAKNQTSPDENDPLQTTTLQTPVLSTLDGVPFSLGPTRYAVPNPASWTPLRNTMSPDMWTDIGYNAYVGLQINTSRVGYIGNSRRYLAGIPDGFYGQINADTVIHTGSGTRKSEWVWQQGRLNNEIHRRNSYNNFQFVTNTGWPFYAGGVRTDVDGSTDIRALGGSEITFDMRGAGMMGIIENDPYENTTETFNRALCSELLLDENPNLNGYLWTNWRSLSVTPHPVTASNILDFKNNDNLVWKFWKNDVSFPDGTSITPPLTTLTYRYKCWHVPIDAYDASTDTLRFAVGGVPAWFDTVLPQWFRRMAPVVGNASLASGGGVQNTIRGPVVHGRFGHIRTGNNPTHLKVSDTSGDTYGYKDATVNTVYRNNDGRWQDLRYKYFGTTLTKIPCADQNIFANNVLTDEYRGFIRLGIEDGSAIFPNGTFALSNTLGFVQGVTGIRMLSGGKDFTNGIYTNVPFRHLYSTAVTTSSFPVSGYQDKTSLYLLSSTSASTTPNVGSLQWYYYGNMNVYNSYVPTSVTEGRETSAARIAIVETIDPNYTVTYFSFAPLVSISWNNKGIQDRPLFWDTTDTYALWFLTAHNCFVISTTADARTPHVLSSDINCFINPSRNNIIGNYSSASGWTGVPTIVYNSNTNSLILEQIKKRDPQILALDGAVTSTYPAFGTVNLFSNTEASFIYENNVFVPPNNNIGNFLINTPDYNRYTRSPDVSAKGTVYVVNNTVIAISATSPGRRITRDQVFTLDALDVGGTGEGVTFRVAGTANTPQNLIQSVTNSNPIGNYYFHTPHIVNNTLSLQENLDHGFSWSVNPTTEGVWGMQYGSGNKELAYTDPFYHFSNDYSDENFVTNHFVFNNNQTVLNQISSIYVCGRWWNGVGRHMTLTTGTNYTFWEQQLSLPENTTIRDNRIDDRKALDLIKQNNSGPILGTLTIENTATGQGMVFYVNDIVPEKRYRWTRGRRSYVYLDKIREIEQANFRSAPNTSNFFMHMGFGTDRCSYFGINKTPKDPNDNEPSLSYYGYPQRGSKVLFDTYNAASRTFTFIPRLSASFWWIPAVQSPPIKRVVYPNPAPNEDFREISIVGRNPITGALSAAEAVWDEDKPFGGGIMTEYPFLTGRDGANDNIFGVSNRDPLLRTSFVPFRTDQNYGAFVGGENSRRTLFDPSYEGYLQYVMFFKTGFDDLTANRWLKSNTLHTAITSFFYETTGNDLTVNIR